jgi:hypothetical protein
MKEKDITRKNLSGRDVIFMELLEATRNKREEDITYYGKACIY